jgi:hypothetical protein
LQELEKENHGPCDFPDKTSVHLGLKVSRGEELTAPVDMDTLTDPESVGGNKDCSAALTRRVLLLSEGIQAGGKFKIADVRKAVLGTYAGADRTRGRHVLSLCNDLARYYRTLCIEYKAKADDPDETWCTRNMKLRHSRKFWYFSCILSIVAIANQNPQGDDRCTVELLKAFEKPPYLRLFEAVEERQRGLVGRILGRSPGSGLVATGRRESSTECSTAIGAHGWTMFHAAKPNRTAWTR